MHGMLGEILLIPYTGIYWLPIKLGVVTGHVLNSSNLISPIIKFTIPPNFIVTNKSRYTVFYIQLALKYILILFIICSHECYVNRLYFLLCS